MVTAHPIPKDPRFIDCTGKKFGRLRVVSYAGRRVGGSIWNCICKCGVETITAGGKLRGKLTKSCGCLSREKILATLTTHGRSGTPEYAIYKTMKGRCLTKTNRQYADYGGRGITICDRWNDSFENFIKDMGNRPHAKMTLERRDNEKGYCPENCYWSTKIQQARNKRSNILLTINGKTQCLSAWAEECGIKYGTFQRRIAIGMNPELAISLPVR